MLFRQLAEYYDKLESISSRLTMIDVLTEALKGVGKDEIQAAIYITQGVLAPAFEGLEFGMAEKLAEEAIAIATGYTKDQVDSSFKKSGDLGLTAQELKNRTKLRSISSNRYSILEVYEMMRKIATTSGSGSKDLKIKMLANLIAAAAPVEAKYIVRYPLGQLRLGVGDSTIMEALSVMATGSRDFKKELERAYNICSDLGFVAEELSSGGKKAIERLHVAIFKPIRPALAERLPTAEEIIERLGGVASVEQKYDGFRLQIHKKGKKVKLYSRRLEDTTEMFPDIVKATMEEVKADEIIFEGEALAFNEATGELFPFQETIQRKRKHGIEAAAEALPLHLFAFDIMYLNGRDMLSEPYEKRRGEIEIILKKGDLILPTTRIITKSPKDLELFFERSIENGLEGIMAKDMKAPYIAGARKFSWIKMKRSYKGELSDSLDLVVLGYFLGRGSRAEFKFGGLLCGTYNKKRDMFETITRLGTGFTEAQMSELKDRLDKIKVKTRPARVDAVVEPDFWVTPRYVVQVNADEITKSPTHTCGREKQKDGTEVGYALRFPRLVGNETIRSDKGPEETTTTQEVIEMFREQRKVSLKDA